MKERFPVMLPDIHIEYKNDEVKVCAVNILNEDIFA